jgi:SAM-dependent methyltransferase
MLDRTNLPPWIGRVLDLGGQDVNGTVHLLLPRHKTLDVLDILPGVGVTIVADIATWDPPKATYDLVVSTEMLEHVQDWARVVEVAAQALTPGGWFVGSCASTGRPPHGATGDPSPADGEWYGTVDPGALGDVLREYFHGPVIVEYSRDPAEPTTHDAYWAAQRAR